MRNARYLLVCGLILFSPQWVIAAEADKAVGLVASVAGTVNVVRADTGVRQQLVFNGTVYLDDMIETGVGGYVKVLLIDDTILKMGPSSALTIDKVVAEPDGKNETLIKLFRGWLRSVIGRKLGPVSSLEVVTPVAVAGVRGTDFEIFVPVQDVTLVRAYEGQVSVRNLHGEIIRTITVIPDTYTTVRKNLPPTAPMTIAPNEALEDKFEGQVKSSEDQKDAGDEDAQAESDNSVMEDAGEELQQAEADQVAEPAIEYSLPILTGIANEPSVPVPVGLSSMWESIGDTQEEVITEPPLGPGGTNVPITIVIPPPP